METVYRLNVYQAMKNLKIPADMNERENVVYERDPQLFEKDRRWYEGRLSSFYDRFPSVLQNRIGATRNAHAAVQRLSITQGNGYKDAKANARRKAEIKTLEELNWRLVSLTKTLSSMVSGKTDELKRVEATYEKLEPFRKEWVGRPSRILKRFIWDPIIEETNDHGQNAPVIDQVSSVVNTEPSSCFDAVSTYPGTLDPSQDTAQNATSISELFSQTDKASLISGSSRRSSIAGSVSSYFTGRWRR